MFGTSWPQSLIPKGRDARSPSAFCRTKAAHEISLVSFRDAPYHVVPIALTMVRPYEALTIISQTGRAWKRLGMVWGRPPNAGAVSSKAEHHVDRFADKCPMEESCYTRMGRTRGRAYS